MIVLYMMILLGIIETRKKVDLMKHVRNMSIFVICLRSRARLLIVDSFPSRFDIDGNRHVPKVLVI